VTAKAESAFAFAACGTDGAVKSPPTPIRVLPTATSSKEAVYVALASESPSCSVRTPRVPRSMPVEDRDDTLVPSHQISRVPAAPFGAACTSRACQALSVTSTVEASVTVVAPPSARTPRFPPEVTIAESTEVLGVGRSRSRTVCFPTLVTLT